jgi:hypothetical protein
MNSLGLSKFVLSEKVHFIHNEKKCYVKAMSCGAEHLNVGHPKKKERTQFMFIKFPRTKIVHLPESSMLKHQWVAVLDFSLIN